MGDLNRKFSNLKRIKRTLKKNCEGAWGGELRNEFESSRLGNEGYLDFLECFVNGGHLMLLVQRRFVAEETHQALVAEAEQLDFFVVLTRVRVPLSVENGVQREGGIPLHNVGQLEARRKQRVGECSSAFRTVPRPMVLLSTPVLRDALSAKIMFAAETNWILIDTQADGAQKFVFQTTSHFISNRATRVETNAN